MSPTVFASKSGIMSVDRPTLLEEDIRGLDRLELPMVSPPNRAERAWRVVWPKLLAAAIVVAAWQVVYWSGWKPPFVLPPPARVFNELGQLVTTERFWIAVGSTMRRAATGFAVALGVGTIVGLAVSQ